MQNIIIKIPKALVLRALYLSYEAQSRLIALNGEKLAIAAVTDLLVPNVRVSPALCRILLKHT